MHRTMRRAAIAIAVVAALLVAGPAAAHSLPQSSQPAAGAVLESPPTVVTITFGEDPDHVLSTIQVLDAGGHVVSSGKAVVAPDDPLTLSVGLMPLGPGVYTVAWRTVSAVDGHSASGSFAFGVGAAPGIGGPGASPITPDATVAASPSAIAILGRFLLYLGLIGLVGGACFGLLVAPPATAVRTRLLPLAWLLAAAGTMLVIGSQVADAGVPPGEVFGSSFGAAISERVVPLLVAGLGVAAVARRSGDRSALLVVALAAAACLAVDVLLSHAAAGSWPGVNVLVQALHVLAVGMWLGGLAGLLLTVGRAPTRGTERAARRFSRLATAGILIVAATGLLRAIVEVGTLDDLLATDFGRLVIAKTALLAGLAVLGALNHFRNVPAAGRSLVGLRRAGSLELVLGATAILLAAALVNLSPPVQGVAASRPAGPGGGPSSPAPTPGPTSPPLVAEGSDFATSVRLRLVVTPGQTGSNAFTATVADYDTGAPVDAVGVSLRFTPPRSDVGTSRLDLVPAGSGTFTATGTNLSLDGTWHVTATVANGAASVEVPLDLTVRSAATSLTGRGP